MRVFPAFLVVMAALAQANEEVLLVVEVSRHGARSPNKLYDFALRPEEEFKNTSQLTLVGRR